jgi:HlyD family secretion protein
MDRQIDSAVRRRRRLRQGTLGAGVALATLTLAAWAAEQLRPAVHRGRARFGVVVRGELEATLVASGTVVPAFERVISCPVAARVERVLLRPGQLVQEGTQILELDTSATRLALERLERQLAQNGNDRLQARLELEEAISALASDIENRKLDLEIARFRLDREQRLWADGLAAEETVREAEVVARKAEIDLRRLDEKVVAVERLHEARLERLAMDAEILRQERDETSRQLELADTAAPLAGVLTSVFEEVGATVASGEILARIADLDSFRVEAQVSDAYASRLALGQDAHVLIGEERLPARVSGVLPTIEEGTARFIVELDDASHRLLRHNLRVEVLVVTGRRHDVLKAPRGPYIHGGGARHPVFVVEDDRARRADVTIGLAGHEYYEIVDGLQEGDEIIISDMRSYLHATRLRLK